MNKIMKMFNTAIFVLTITVTGITHADNVEIKLASGDGFKVQDSNGSPLMDILSNGYVGIGNTSPDYKLDVSGDINFTGSLYQNGSTFSGSAWATGGSGIYYNSGNVGIGTTSPGEKLEVSGNISASKIIATAPSSDYAFSPSSSQAGLAVVRMTGSGTAGSYYQWEEQGSFSWFLGIDDSGNDFNFRGGNIATSPQMTITNAGNVGIGTTSPGTKLDIVGGGVRTDGLFVVPAEQGYEWWMGRFTDLQSWQLTHRRISDASWSNALTVSISGNVGIGTTSPSYALDVVGDINCSGSLRESGSPTIADYVFKDDYNLPSIEKHADFMWKQKHLPKVSGANEIKGKSYSISERREQVLEELEIAHIYIEQLHRQNKALEERLTKLETRFSEI